MASVALSFQAPGVPNITELQIYESPTQFGTYTQIDSTTDVGEFPDYINHFTTDEATSVDYWFSIAWVDSEGATSPLSDPWQGNTESIVSLVVERVMQRGWNVDETIVIQEAEVICEMYFSGDPYTVELPVSYRVLSGLTYLTIASVMAGQPFGIAGGVSFTAGLVSMKGDQHGIDMKEMVRLGMKYLGISQSVIGHIENRCAENGWDIVETDLSRLVVDVE